MSTNSKKTALLSGLPNRCTRNTLKILIDLMDSVEEECKSRSISTQTELDDHDTDLPHGDEMSAIQQMIQDEGLESLIDEDSMNIMKQVEEQIMTKIGERRRLMERKELFHLSDILPSINGAVCNVVCDDFTACFRHATPDWWKWNLYYFTLYHLGVVFRYVILAPLRILFIILCTLLTVFVISVAQFFGFSNESLRCVLQCYANIWLVALGAVVKVKSPIPERRVNQVFVSNHTTQLDIAFLQCSNMFSVIGQNGTSPILRILQYVLSPMDNILFERFEKHDRVLVKYRINQHMKDITKPPLLIFPEGVCVNNRYTVMFRKGAFEMEDVEICPIAMKYDLSWSDPFKGDEGFLFHLLRLFKSWATVVEIHYLEPVKRNEGEESIHFANRVKSLISDRIGLKNVGWNGYLKYFKASQRFLDGSRVNFSKRIFKRKKVKPEQEGEEEES